MDATLLCLLRDFETAKEVPRYIDRLDEEVVKLVDKKLKDLLSDNWEISDDESSLNEDDSFAFCKANWMEGDDWLTWFSFENDDDEDDYDNWLNHFLGYSKYPFCVVLTFSGLLENNCVDKTNLIIAANKLKEKLLSDGFTESTAKGKKVYCFSRPITFEKQKLFEAFENKNPDDGISNLGVIIAELDSYTSLIDEIVNKYKKLEDE